MSKNPGWMNSQPTTKGDIFLEKKEKDGIICVIITIVIAGALPVIIKYGVGFINPLFFATTSSLIAGVFLFVLAAIKGNWRVLFRKEYLFSLFVIGFFGITLSNLFFFYGAFLTSAINTSILLVIEPLYSIFIGYLFLNEKITFKQIIFTFIIIIGTVTVLYKVKLILNWGDLMVLGTPLCWQIAHFFSKRLMTSYKEITPPLIATARTLYGGIFLFILSSVIRTNQFSKLGDFNVLWILLLQGIVGFALHYSIWYEAIKRLNLSKATSLVSVYPAFSIILAWFVLKEFPTFQQITGFAIIIIGVFGLSGIKSENRIIKEKVL
ncbi:MAG: DMT family transporter [Candidatus Caldatribacteriota bacterium]|nr:DMT family transporter [Candidatus Caldatribacteriota bacterium]